MKALFIAETINSTPIEITINPIILDKAFIPDAPNIFTIKKELLKTIYIKIVANKIAPIIMNI